MNMKPTFFLGIFILFWSQYAVCWECSGHMVIWQIALSQLGSQFYDQNINPLLIRDLDQYQNKWEYACWPDVYKQTHPENKPWHFIRVPFFDHYINNDPQLNPQNVA